MTAAPDLPFISGNTPTARLMRDKDWASSPLGPPQQWPQPLRSVVSLMLGSAFPMFVAWGPSLHTLYNEAYGEIMGAKHPEGMGQPFLDIWDEIRDDLAPLVQRVVGGEAFFMENLYLRIQRRGFDEDTWFTFSYSPVLDEAGAVAGFFCACTETTRMVRAERHQRAEQERLQSLFSQAPGFIAIMRGPHHVFEIANQAYRQLTGFRDVIGKPLAEALPEVVEQGFVKLLDQVFSTGEPYVGRSVRLMLIRERDAPPSEAWVDFVYQPLRDAAGAVNGVFVQGHEVTELQRTQQALLAFSNSIPAIAWVAAADGPLERFNSQWQAYTGQTAESALGSGWMASLHPDDRAVARENWARVRSSNQEWQVDYRLRGSGGGYRWFQARVVPQLDADGRVLRWFGTTTDIEETRAAAQVLQEADQQKDEFLATLAHELRNPLAPIRTAVHLLTTPAATAQVRDQATAVITRQVGHMAHLLDDLIDIARITRRRLTLKKQQMSVDEVVDTALETARPLAEARGQVLEATVAGQGLQLMADPVRLAQILANLLNNASKYTDVGGRIALDVTLQPGAVVFTVTDSGIGMSEVAMGNIFTMFAQEQSALDRSDGGLGIGLALVKGLVELHGGSVSAYSAGPGRGSRFTVMLPGPMELPEAAHPAQVEGSPGQPERARTVLLADDNRDAVDLLAELLRLDGHVVHVANDGLEAVALAARIQPDVLVLDIGMPGMNGYEVARHIRAQPGGGRPMLIAATGWGQDDDRQKAMAAGFDLHLTKPFDPLRLSSAISARSSSQV